MNQPTAIDMDFPPITNDLWSQCPDTGHYATEASDLSAITPLDPWGGPLGEILDPHRNAGEITHWTAEVTAPNGAKAFLIIFND